MTQDTVQNPQKEELTWSVDMEINLFHAMRYHKPVGVNKHFHMMFIYEKLNKKISREALWSKLSTLYDLTALDQSEVIPFPNKTAEFSLPDEFHSVNESQEVGSHTEDVETKSDVGEDKERTRHTSGSSTRSTKDTASTTSRKGSDRTESKISKTETRKRTRQSVGTPGETGVAPSKRQRRT